MTLKDNNSALKLELHYYIYEDCDVITRSAKLINDGENAVQIRRLMSCQVDFPTSDYVFTSFHGAWAREMRRWDVPVISITAATAGNVAGGGGGYTDHRV